MQAWFQFYVVTAGAAATLLGLLFVAVSVNAAAILHDANGDTKRLAEQALQNYLAVLLLSLLTLIPPMSLRDLGFTALALTLIRAGWVLLRSYHTLTRSQDAASRIWSLRRQFSSLLGYGLVMFAALRMALSKTDSESLFAAGVLVLLFGATTVAWELLVSLGKAIKRS